MASVEVSGWLPDLVNLFGSYPGLKFWSIERDEIYIKISDAYTMENTWQLWAKNVSTPLPVMITDSVPFNATTEDPSWMGRK